MASTQKTKIVRMEIEIVVPEGATDRALRDATSAACAVRDPDANTISVADAFESAGLTVNHVANVHVGDDTPDFDQVQDMALRWYRGEILGALEDAIERLLAIGADEREDRVSDVLHEIIDGRQCIIYTAQAQMVIAASQNASAYQEIYGDDLQATDEQRAFAALERDVSERLDTCRERWHPDHTPDTEECADCGASTAPGTPDPHVCTPNTEGDDA